MRIRLSVEGGGGRARPPWPMAGPRGRDRQAAPPPLWPTGGIPRGPKAPPHSPPPPPSEARERAPPPLPPHPPQLGSHRRGPPPPKGRGGAPTHRRNGDTVRATAPGPANPHRRAEATRTTEHEGGRAPHDPPVTTAHSEGTEGGFAGQLGPPGERSTGRPSPPPTPGRHFSPDRTRAPEGSAPATRSDPRGEPECDLPPRSSRRPTRGPRRTSGPTPAHRDAAQIVPREAG